MKAKLKPLGMPGKNSASLEEAGSAVFGLRTSSGPIRSRPG
jgi:hypothetical protein